MTAADMVATYRVTTEKAAVIIAARRYMTSEGWNNLMRQLEGMRR